MNPNDINGWYLFTANKSKYTFRRIDNHRTEITIKVDSWEEAKNYFQNNVQIAQK